MMPRVGGQRVGLAGIGILGLAVAEALLEAGRALDVVLVLVQPDAQCVEVRRPSPR